MTRISLLVLGCLVLLSGCAKTTVVLLPDDSGSVGKVIVQAVGEQRVLSQAEERVQASSEGLSTSANMPADTVQRVFGTTLQALPQKPESTLIYFASESTLPTEASLRQLKQVAETLKSRVVPSVELFGHTDHLGDTTYNQKLSESRATEVRRLLISRGVPDETIHTKGFGPNDPLVPQQPGKAEPRNRRVEIFVR